MNFKNKNVEEIQNPQMVQTENVSTPNQEQNTEPKIDVLGQEVTENLIQNRKHLLRGKV